MRDPPWWKNCFFPYKFNPPGNWNKNELLCILLCIYIKSSLKWRKVIRHHLHFSHYFSESSHDKTELSRTELNRQGRSAADNGREGGHHSIWAQLNVGAENNLERFEGLGRRARSPGASVLA